MEFKKFAIEGLFGLYSHTIDFQSSKSADKKASIIMLYGKNGIGKTTILRMIEGLMKLDFTVFRQVKFHRAFLEFSNNHAITVEGHYNKDNVLDYLKVQYKDSIVKLNPKETGPLNAKESVNQDTVKENYKADLEKFSFEYIDTERLIKRNIKDEMLLNEHLVLRENVLGKIKVKPDNKESTYLAQKVKAFIRESQV